MQDSSALVEKIVASDAVFAAELVKHAADVSVPYSVMAEYYYFFAGLVISDELDNQERATKILGFINHIMNGREYDDETKNMVYLGFIEMLLGPVGPNAKDLDEEFEHKKMKLAKQCFTGEALYWLRNAVQHSNDAYRNKYPYIFE